MSPSQQAVQCVHAAVRLAYYYGDSLTDWLTIYERVVILGVDDEAELRKWISIILSRYSSYCVFYEADLNNEPTAVAVHPENDPEIFNKLTLL